MKSVAAFTPSSSASAMASNLHMAASDVPSRRAFVQKSAALAATAVPGWFANFDGHVSGCQCSSCGGVHSAGCSCGSCVNGHSLGCQCNNCTTSGPLSSVGNVSNTVLDLSLRNKIELSNIMNSYPNVFNFIHGSVYVLILQ